MRGRQEFSIIATLHLVREQVAHHEMSVCLREPQQNTLWVGVYDYAHFPNAPPTICRDK